MALMIGSSKKLSITKIASSQREPRVTMRESREHNTKIVLLYYSTLRMSNGTIRECEIVLSALRMASGRNTLLASSTVFRGE